MLFFDFLTSFMPIILGLMGVLMVVLRAGASRVFFDIVGTFQADKMLKDTSAHMTIMQGLVVDGLAGIEDAGSLLAQQMNAVVDATVPLSQELEKATIQFEKFISVGAATEGTLTRQIQEVGMQFGFTANQSLEAGARMAQLSSILGEEVIPQATEAALAFGLMGDMTPETAMIKLINLQQQTGFAFRDTTQAAFNQMSVEQKRIQVTKEMSRTLNELNSVEDHSAATLSKITGVMNEFASQAHLAGESIAMMAAQSAALIEAGEEQGKAGRALRMTYARLGADTSGAATALNDLGVATTEANGSLKPMSDIMKELNPKWQTFNSGQKQAIAQQVAGNRHYVRFIKLMEAYDRVMQLNMEATEQTAAVMTEAGEAVGFLGDMMDSNAVKLDRARAELELTNATIGDVFIPGQIEAINIQNRFNQTIVDTIVALDGSEKGLSKLFGLGKALQTTFAPFFSAFINVKATNLALLTQVQIVRALSGVQLGKSAKEQSNHAQNEENLKTENQLIKLQTDLMKNLVSIEKNRAFIQKQNTEGTKKYGFTVHKLNVSKERLIFLEKQRKGLIEQEIILTDQLTHATNALNTSSMKLSMTMMKISGIFMIIDVSVMALSSLLGDKLVMGIDLARLSMILMALTMGFMMIETMITTGAIIAQTVAINADTTSKVVNTAATGALGKATIFLANAINFAKRSLKSFLVFSGVGLVFLAVGLAIEKLLPKSKAFDDAMISNTDSVDALSASFADMEANMALSVGSDVDFSGLDSMKNKTQEFANAREEMFFGFKADAVTGDLVKQVKHTGVENFVANTEVIMTNNFTGLTSDEIANEVIRKIQQKGSASGMVI